MKGILMKPEGITAVAEGRKTNTRRVEAGLKEINQEPNGWKVYSGKNGFIFIDIKDTSLRVFIKPRYQVGETVYIKETHYRYGHWEETSEFTKGGRHEWEFVPDADEVCYKENRPDRVNRATLRMIGWYKRSPLFMPAWAARYFILIKDVRAERLQEISIDDIRAEGIDIALPPLPYDPLDPQAIDNKIILDEFIHLWNSINAKWKRVYNKELKIYEFWQFPWCEADAVPIPKTTKHPERYHCVPNPWVFRYEFELKEVPI